MRVYVQYETLYLAEFRALLRDLERAYNKVDSAAADSRRVLRRRRLTVEVLRTGQSIETILVGSVSSLLLLVKIVKEVIGLRHTHWAAEEQKWKALEQRVKAKQAEQSANHETNEPKALVTAQPQRSQQPTSVQVDELARELANDPRVAEARVILAKSIKKVERSKTISSVQVDIVDIEPSHKSTKVDKS